jgi:glycerol kinase
VLVETEEPAREGVLRTAAARLDGEPAKHALEGAVFVTGAALQWLRDGLGLIDDASESEQIAASLADNGGVYFVPALAGLGSPHWRSDARGTVTGLTRGATRAHLVRAALEAAAYQTRDVLEAMPKLELLRADGGMSRNRWLMQFQADVLGIPVETAREPEQTALGAALLALGRRQASPAGERFEPQGDAEPLYTGWRGTLPKTLA